MMVAFMVNTKGVDGSLLYILPVINNKMNTFIMNVYGESMEIYFIFCLIEMVKRRFL
jgi:hypothetical protein